MHRRTLAMLFALAALATPSRAQEDDDEPDADTFREQLTEREDKRRPLEPFHIDLAGHPLVLGGEYEIDLDAQRNRVIGGESRQRDRVLFDQGLELEAFYSIGQPLSIFAQFRLAMDEDLLPHTPDDLSDLYVEREEMWLHTENIAGSPLSLEVGRLDFEDDRRWWWDADLDAVRANWEGEQYEVELSAARELFSTRSDHADVEPDQNGVLRILGEASWDFLPSHGLELFFLHQDDGSPTPDSGEFVSDAQLDESDARLTWVGMRLLGAFDFGPPGTLGYWLDAAGVRGGERVTEFEGAGSGRNVASGHEHRDVRGFGIDVGLEWALRSRLEPRFIAGFALGSGDTTPDTGSDTAFRQTQIHANEAGYGGVQRYSQYGVLLDPELSNLEIATFGAGIALLRASSLDLVYHRYRLLDPATSLRAAAIDATLDGVHHEIGDELDLVLALEEWERFEIEIEASAFRAGDAFAADAGTWSYLGFLAVRYAF